MAHTIDVAKSSRASCRTCKQKIEKDALRFGEEYENQFSGEGDTAYRWHHLPCAAQKLPTELRTALDAYGGPVPDRAELDKLMAEGLKKVDKKPAAFPYVDRAPTGRAKCIHCQQPIAKDSFRVAIEREVDTGSFVTKGPGYLHPACVRAQGEAIERDHDELMAGVRANSKLGEEELAQIIAQLEA
jgi:hypothetical protein